VRHYTRPGHPICQRKIDGVVAKRLANLWIRNRIKKNAHAGREKEIKWEIPDESIQSGESRRIWSLNNELE
jgi:hypothetical protein